MTDVLARARELEEAGQAHAVGTVVRVDRPVSARPGDRAVITSEGVLQGWVGGSCTEPIVIREALSALADGAPRLLRMRPAGAAPSKPEAGVITEVTTCASEGGVDVFIEPRQPRPRIFAVGSSPATRSLVELATGLGYRTIAVLDDPSERIEQAASTVSPEKLATMPLRPEDAVVVGTMNRYDEAGLSAALETAAGYIGLIASRRRAEQVRKTLRAQGAGPTDVARIHSPAGVDLGPSSQEEIGLALLAEIVAHKNRLHEDSSTTICAPDQARDPVCGMSVAITDAAVTAQVSGTTHYFCSPGCRDAFLLRERRPS